MNGTTLFFVILATLVAYTLYKRFKAGTFTANEKMFSQAGITVHFDRSMIRIKNREFNIEAVTNIRTEPPRRNQALAYDCVISVSDFKLPEHRVRFITETKANQFMQRLATAIEKAGGPSFR